jgi:hypothetical protein
MVILTGDCNSFFCEICVSNQQPMYGFGLNTLELPVGQRISNYTLKLTFDTVLDRINVRK